MIECAGMIGEWTAVGVFFFGVSAGMLVAGMAMWGPRR